MQKAGHAEEEIRAGAIVTLLRQVEVEIANGKNHPASLEEA